MYGMPKAATLLLTHIFACIHTSTQAHAEAVEAARRAAGGAAGAVEQQVAALEAKIQQVGVCICVSVG